MATSDGDVNMTDAAVPATSATASESVSQPARTDHERQYFFLPTTPVPRPRVHSSKNLISDYGLDAMHEKVRRFDVHTGEKINKMRKSYVNIVRDHIHIAGLNKEVPAKDQWVSNDRAQPGVLDLDDDTWKVQVARRPVTQSAAQSMLSKLDKAVQMAPGRPDDSDKWKKLLGDDVTKKSAIPVPSLRQQFQVKTVQKEDPNSGRGQRKASKRKYDDSSFAGYQETFEDVAGVTDFKKARKVGSPPYRLKITFKRYGGEKTEEEIEAERMLFESASSTEESEAD